MLSNQSRKALARIVSEVRANKTNQDWQARTLRALDVVSAAPDEPIASEYRKRAIEERHVEGDLEIDDDAIVSITETGAYVQSWVWVSK